MKRGLTVGFIVVYLAALTYGNVCHMIGYGTGSHPLMYYFVWDMFSGWIAYDSRAVIVAEGESQAYYELSPGPWGELLPWGNLGRQHYDPFNNHTHRLAFNALNHSTHEPITRIFVIEESWPKKFNLPDAVWRSRYDDPKDIQKYYHVRSVLLPDGQVVRSYGPWTQVQAQRMLADNPRLKSEASRGRSLFVGDGGAPGRDLMVYPSAGAGTYQSNIGSPKAN